MNIRWNTTERRFEAEFTTDFQGDLSAVKNASFKTDGPPAWAWWTQKVAVLNKLRKDRPASGLTITPEALEIYKPLAAIEEQNEATKKQLADFRKKAKKERKAVEQEAASQVVLAGLSEEKWWIGTEDLLSAAPFVSNHVITTLIPSLKCLSCGQPVYFYEKQNPPTCLWCEAHS